MRNNVGILSRMARSHGICGRTPDMLQVDKLGIEPSEGRSTGVKQTLYSCMMGG